MVKVLINHSVHTLKLTNNCKSILEVNEIDIEILLYITEDKINELGIQLKDKLSIRSFKKKNNNFN
jgi:hypothetical protein